MRSLLLPLYPHSNECNFNIAKDKGQTSRKYSEVAVKAGKGHTNVLFIALLCVRLGGSHLTKVSLLMFTTDLLKIYFLKMISKLSNKLSSERLSCLGNDSWSQTSNPNPWFTFLSLAITLLLRLCEVFVLFWFLFCFDCVTNRQNLTEKLNCKTDVQVVYRM